jgi:hypothetical protein
MELFRAVTCAIASSKLHQLDLTSRFCFRFYLRAPDHDSYKSDLDAYLPQFPHQNIEFSLRTAGGHPSNSRRVRRYSFATEKRR